MEIKSVEFVDGFFDDVPDEIRYMLLGWVCDRVFTTKVRKQFVFVKYLSYLDYEGSYSFLVRQVKKEKEKDKEFRIFEYMDCGDYKIHKDAQSLLSIRYKDKEEEVKNA